MGKIRRRPVLCVLLFIASTIPLYAQAEEKNEAFLFGSIVNPFTVNTLYYNYNYGGDLIDLYIGLKYEILFGPKMAEFKNHAAIYFVGSPYLLAESGSIDTYVTEVGISTGFIYLGKPLLLGIEFPLYCFGNVGLTKYSSSILDLFAIRGLIGLNAHYTSKTIFGKEKVHRLYTGLSIIHYPYGQYANYTSVSIFIGRSY